MPSQRPKLRPSPTQTFRSAAFSAYKVGGGPRSASPVVRFSEEQSCYELHCADSDGCEPADHERHPPSCPIEVFREVVLPRYGNPDAPLSCPLNSALPTSKTGPPPLYLSPQNQRLNRKAINQPNHHAGRRASTHRLLASNTANTAARSGLCRISAVPVNITASRPPIPCRATNTTLLSTASTT